MNLNNRQFSRRQLLLASAIVPFGLSALLFDSVTAQANSSGYGIQGKVAPEVTLDYWIDSTGNPGEWSVAKQKGKWVYLYCFQDWCPGCHAHGFPALKKLDETLGEHNSLSIAAVQTVFEGFLMNTQSDVKKLQEKYQLTIPMGHDAGSAIGDHRPQIMKSYRTGGTPWTIIIDPNGVVVFNDYHIQIDNFIQFIESQPS